MRQKDGEIVVELKVRAPECVAACDDVPAIGNMHLGVHETRTVRQAGALVVLKFRVCKVLTADGAEAANVLAPGRLARV